MQYYLKYETLFHTRELSLSLIQASPPETLARFSKKTSEAHVHLGHRLTIKEIIVYITNLDTYIFIY